MKMRLAVAGAVAFVCVGGAAAAVAVKTITLRPGRCTRATKQLRVCAAVVSPRAVTVTQPVTVTVTTTPAPRVAFEDGTFRVGTDIQPGTYQTAAAVGSGGLCYWARLSGFGGTLDDIIANDDVTEGTAIVTIAPSDTGFTSNGCGAWGKIG